MESPSTPSAVLSSLLRAHEALEACIREMDASPAAVLDAGRTLLDFARREDEMFGALVRWLDPVVLKEMAAEHEEIARDLELLEWLLTTASESSDAATLAESLARRMHQHVSRDGRLLARAARPPGGSQPG